MFFQNSVVRSILISAYKATNFARKSDLPFKVYINSLPKSGTHLITGVLDSYKDFSVSAIHMKKYEVNLHSKTPLNNSKFELDLNAFNKLIGSCGNGQIITSHLPWLPEYETLRKQNVKILHFIRDPRDIFVSEFFYIKNLKRHFQHDIFCNELKSDQERVNALLYGHSTNKQIIMRPFEERLQEYLGWHESELVKVCKYENFAMQCEPDPAKRTESLKEIFQFFGLTTTDTELRKVIETSDSKKSYTFRKGGSGGWKNFLSTEQQTRMKEEIEDVMIAMGYDW